MSEHFAKTAPLSLPGAVVLLMRKHSGRRGSSGRHTKEALRRWRRRYGGHFPDQIQQLITAASQEVVDLILSGRIEARATRCDENGNTEGEEPIDLWFLKRGIIADPLADMEILADWMAEGGFGRQGGYRDVYLDRAQFIEVVGAQKTFPQPESSPPNVARDPREEIAARSSALQEQARGGFSTAQLESWYRDVWIKRKEKEEKIPSREEDWEAARSEVSPNLPRDAVRQIRREFAPASWMKPGRRKETGGN
jgi:hypothetical protein